MLISDWSSDVCSSDLPVSAPIRSSICRQMACRRYGGPMTDELPDNPPMDEAFMAGMRPSRRGRSAELLTIADRAAAHVKRPSVDHAALLYHENGERKSGVWGRRGYESVATGGGR